VQRGRRLGSKPFREEMRRYVQEKRGKWHYGAELWESAQAKAQQLIAEELRGEGVTEDQLKHWRQGGIASKSAWPCGCEQKQRFRCNG
jgi:hypothetical protein